MRKQTFPLLLLISAFTFLGCGQTTNSNDSVDSIESSVADDTVAVNFASAPQSVADAVAERYLSDDLSFLDLYGPVRSMTQVVSREGEDYQRRKYEFDRDGKLLSINGKDPFVVPATDDYDFEFWWERDSEGRIAKTDLFRMGFTEDGRPDVGITYTWEDGRVVSAICDTYLEGKSHTVLTYEYDSNHRLTHRRGPERYEGKTTERYYDYKYKSFDERGNWTDRVLTTNDTGFSGEPTMTYTHSRKISYY